eukprot:CAMPEP_0184490918 /NCGR_PEP_ID=MMETSP0113_2-20130426/19200_1 /TAXON_ID=91329 /ORGANISM="Norrisiella sphaerica, Strain BC52" /LENGTH=719 /DNA_ID=CAMNT_0026875045 /DNA_START=170 /DNA_END=2329 /DNA_ORIENTATION=+
MGDTSQTQKSHDRLLEGCDPIYVSQDVRNRRRYIGHDRATLVVLGTLLCIGAAFSCLKDLGTPRLTTPLLPSTKLHGPASKPLALTTPSKRGHFQAPHSEAPHSDPVKPISTPAAASPRHNRELRKIDHFPFPWALRSHRDEDWGSLLKKTDVQVALERESLGGEKLQVIGGSRLSLPHPAAPLAQNLSVTAQSRDSKQNPAVSASTTPFSATTARIGNQQRRRQAHATESQTKRASLQTPLEASPSTRQSSATLSKASLSQSPALSLRGEINANTEKVRPRSRSLVVRASQVPAVKGVTEDVGVTAGSNGNDGNNGNNNGNDNQNEEDRQTRATVLRNPIASGQQETQESATARADIWELAGQGCCEGEKMWGGYLGGREHCKQLCVDTPPCTFASHGWSGMGSSWCDLFDHCESPSVANCEADNAMNVETFHMLRREGIGKPVLGAGGYRTSGHGILSILQNTTDSNPILQSLDVVGGNAYEKSSLLATWAMSTALTADAVTGIHSVGDVVQAGAAISLSVLFSDLFTGVFHWAVDNYGNRDTPVFGAVIEAFQVHHDYPWTLTYRPFATNAFAISLSVLPVLVVATALGPMASEVANSNLLGPNWELAVVVFTNAQILSQEFHKYTHMKRIPKPIKALQDCGAILPRTMHQNHHRSPFGDNYCILTGQMNPLLDSTNFFRRLEKLVYTCTGNEPKCWQLSDEMKQGVLKGDFSHRG